MTSVVERAVALAERIPPTEIERLSRQLEIVSLKMEHDSALLGNLLGIEKMSNLKIQNDLEILKYQRVQLQNRIIFGARYHLLSMEPLTWRDKNGWPRLVVFDLDSPHFELEVVLVSRFDETSWDRRITKSARFIPQRRMVERKKRNGRTTFGFETRQLPGPITSCYADVLAKLGVMAEQREKSLKLSCCFKGMIPDDVKQEIVRVRKSFEEMFLVAEPKNFRVIENDVVILQPSIPKPSRDPLIVGFDGSQLWLIDDFETTSVEEAMIFSRPGATKN